MYKTILILLICFRACIGTGLSQARALIGKPENPRPTLVSDILLQGLANRVADTTYKYNVLRMRIGMAWEMAFLDFGFEKLRSGIDLVNHHRKIAIELKNSYRVNSKVLKVDSQRLKEFKRQHPDYTVILGHINDRTESGRSVTRNGVRYMYGRYFLRYIMEGRATHVINELRKAVKNYIRRTLS